MAGPAVVFWLGYLSLMAFRDADEAMAERNAGRVVNARVVEGSAVEAMDRLLAARPPEVLILGPSYANTNVRPAQLAAALGLPPEEVSLLSVPNSVGAHWYSILKYRVFGAGYRPRLIVVVSGLQSMLLHTPLTESSFVNLQIQLPDGGDPVIDEKVRGSAGLAMAQLREQRGKVREALFSSLRHRAVWWWSPEQTRAALGRVFDDRHVDMSLHDNAIPIVEASRAQERAYTPDLLPSPAESFLSEISRLAAAHEAQIVWVRPPMSPHIPEHLDDVVLDGVQEEAVALVEAEGGVFVDMRSLPMTSTMFKNEDHMNEEGSRRFTHALATALEQTGALVVGPPAPLPPVPVSVTARPPAPPPPPQLAELAGPGRWIPPGGAVVFHVEQAWPDARGCFQIAVVAEHAPTGGDTAPLAVRHAGLQVPLVSAPPGLGLERWTGLMSTSSPPAAFEVQVEVPPGGPWVRLSALALGAEPRQVFLQGDRDDLQGRRVALRGVEHSLAPTYLAAPVRVPRHDRPVTDLPQTPVAAFETERWAFLSDEATLGATSWGRPCSPLRITEDGIVLPGANVSCTEVRRAGRGRSCHTTDRIFFTASDDTDPARNGRTYRLVLDEARSCDGDVWLYPKDRLRLPIPAEILASLPQGASVLTLDLRYLNFREADVDVRLLAGDQVRLEARFDGRQVKRAPIAWRLDPPLTEADGALVLELDNREHTFYLIREVVFSERWPIVPGMSAPTP
ncbi:MAG TPA: hypothetical protein ENK18_28415 [Deltaproteobacteria bacterium]|nr:hypothetical protein [Deltaproteobacteria bacterium]